jgi:hypothetical protein
VLKHGHGKISETPPATPAVIDLFLESWPTASGLKART